MFGYAKTHLSITKITKIKRNQKSIIQFNPSKLDKPSGQTCRIRGYLFRRSLSNNASSLLSSTWAKVNHIITICDDVQVMFDDNYSCAQIKQLLKNMDKSLRVKRIESPIVGSSKTKMLSSCRIPISAASFNR